MQGHLLFVRRITIDLEVHLLKIPSPRFWPKEEGSDARGHAKSTKQRQGPARVPAFYQRYRSVGRQEATHTAQGTAERQAKGSYLRVGDRSETNFDYAFDLIIIQHQIKMTPALVG